MATEKRKPIEEMNVFERLAEVGKICEVIRKDKDGHNYMYVPEDEILAKVEAGVEKYRLFLVPVICPGTLNVTPYSYTKTKFLKGGETTTETVNEFYVTAEMEYHWINLDNPSDFVRVPWVMVGQQANVSQAVGSGLTYMNRYFMLKFFQIATPNDDPDNWVAKKAEAGTAAEAAIASGIIEEVQSVVTSYLERFTDEDDVKLARTKVSAIVKKYAKDRSGRPTADYRCITDPDIAAKLLDELNKEIGGKEE